MRTRLVLCSVAMMVSACGEIGRYTEPVTEFPPLYEEIHGTLVTAVAPERAIEWSTSNKLGFIAPSRRRAMVRDMASGAEQTVHSADTLASWFDLRHIGVGPDGQIFVTEFTLYRNVYRIRSGMPTELLTDGGALPNASLVTYPALSLPAGDVAYVQRDSLYVKRGTAAAVHIGGQCGALAAVSPDGNEAVCLVGDVLRRISLISGAITPMAIDPDSDVLEVIWNAAGLHFLTSKGGVYSLMRPDGSRLSAPALPPNEWEIVHRGVVVSRDLSKMAYWTYYCPPPDIFHTCGVGQRALYLVHLATRRVFRIAVHSTADGSNGALAFSPDGNQVAYVLGNNLYVIGAP